MEHRDFELDERVWITKTESILDGLFGTVLGKSTEGVIDIYIILLDVPLENHRAVTIPECCLYRI